MTRVKRYIDANVLDEARRRIHHICDLFDTVVVAFSGGKDSLAVLHLTREVLAERGIDHVNVVFRDEELIPDPVIEFVDQYRREPWVRMTWYAVPLESHKYVLGKTYRYVQWDPNREHLRPKPEWAVTLEDLGLPPNTVLSQYEMDEIIARPFKGRVAILTGVRAAESLMRLRACMAKLNEPYINASSSKKAALCKPIYDWEENDVFRFFYDRGIRYCPLYDAQLWARSELRVSTPLHAEAAKHFGNLRAVAPTFYAQIIDLFPEMTLQERYYRELDRDAALRQYAGSWDGIKQWIFDNITDPAQRKLALTRLQRTRIAARRAPDSYPLDYVLKQFIRGAYKRRILPQAPGDRSKRKVVPAS
ncbi:Phage protein (plasmid) [Carbonactinospora thermoautotrophica]|uniref:Phage protein n=1 Tax=Carbonactinospora thermoautotrophica TaxID=1469144 RepID=A0A132MIW9_9ACTN|nr:phosphoadenosine phosphosulfate reductase family protein [Carbonactinospora thermoautotrophica]KWW97371.1 Phage protein [Carbonactinospora thermoautotrophica]